MTHGKRARRAIVRAIITAAVGLAAFAAAASASTLSIGVGTATPEQGVPVQLTFSGTTDGVGAPNGLGYLDAIARPAGAIPCQATYSADHTAAGGASFDILETTESTNSPYSETRPWTPPSPGDYVVCAWLSQESDGNTEVTGPITTALAVRGPQVSALSVSLPTAPVRGHQFRIQYTTQTDQSLELRSVVKPSGGLGCGASYALERNVANWVGHEVIEGTSVFGGPTVSTAEDTEPAGNYLICSWIEGPSSGEVDAALTTPFSIAGPPPKPVKAAPALAITALSASTGSGISVSGTTAAGLAGPLRLTATCNGRSTRATMTAAGGAFSGQLPLPSRCGAGDRVIASVDWAGSTTFLKGTARTSTTVTHPMPRARLRRTGPTLFSVSRERRGRTRNILLVRPRTVVVDPSHGGRLSIRWSRWSSRSARGAGTAHGRHRSYPVQVTASHPIRGTFACLAIVDYRQGRRNVERMGLGRVFGRTFTWLPVRYLHQSRSGATPWPRPGCPS